VLGLSQIFNMAGMALQGFKAEGILSLTYFYTCRKRNCLQGKNLKVLNEMIFFLSKLL